jgi:hypothetical protein
VLAWRQNTGAFTSEYRGKRRFHRFGLCPGSSDIIGILPGGRFLAVECKVGKNKPTPSQESFLREVNESGGLGLCVWSVDELMDELDSTQEE